MPRKMKPFIVFSVLLLTMCRFYDEGARLSPINGLACQAYTDYFKQGLETSKGMECYYSCPDGTVAGPIDFESDPSFSFSKGDLDRMLCGVVPKFTATQPAAEASPSPTEPATASPTGEASPTPESSPTPASPLLSGDVTMCDTGINLISFRIVGPPPDLTGRTLEVQISELESTCAVNPTNPSLLTCTIPPGVTFPARVVVSLDGVVVNDFTYDGLGCEELSTAMPTTTP